MFFSSLFARRVALVEICSRRKTRTVRDNGTNNVSPKATVIWKWKDWPETKGLGRRWGRYTATTPTAWEATTSVRRPRSLLLVRRFFAVRYFRFSHCAAFIISSPGRGLSFSLCCLSPSPFFVDYVPFSTEYRSFRSASSKREKMKKMFLFLFLFLPRSDCLDMCNKKNQSCLQKIDGKVENIGTKKSLNGIPVRKIPLDPT